MNFKKVFTFYFCLVCVLTPIPIYAQESNEILQLNKINAKGAILVEEESMRILWGKNEDIPLPMASTTKIITCVVALERGNMQDVVVASKRATSAPRVKLNLKIGEKQTLEDLLYALMLESSNDAAIAIAEHIGGSVEKFCDMMTQKAREIGATTATFKTPNGLDAEGHVASPYDLALITKHAYKNPEFMKIINTKSRNIPSKSLDGSSPHTLQNKNRFLSSYEGANGVKTGFTGLAGHCFVGGAKKDGMQLFAVVLASGWGARGRSQKYTDTIRLLEYGFNKYKKVAIKQAMDSAGEVPVIRGEEKIVSLVYANSLSLPLTQQESEEISISLNIPQNIKAPIYQNQKLGTADIYIGKSLVATLPLISVSNINKKTIATSFKKAINEWINLLQN